MNTLKLILFLLLLNISIMANDLMSEYNDVPVEGVEPPKNYKPLTSEERAQWNDFIRFVNQEKKMGGDKSLDVRDKSVGIELMEEYRQKNPKFTLTPAQIPSIQYEHNTMREMNALPDQTDLNPHIKSLIKNSFPADRELSPVDGWLGSLTSKQAYPEIQEFTDDPLKQKFRVDYRGASEYANKHWNKKSK
jgi:hypothetical protein